MICSAYAPPLGFRPRTFRPYWCVPIGRCRYGVVRHAAQHRSDHLDGSGGSGNEFVSLGRVKSDSDRNALGQPNPVESRVDVGKEGCAGAAVSIFDTRRDAFHFSAQHVIVAQQPHIDSIADMDARQLGFLEVTLDTQRIRIEQGHHALARREIGL
jgi:hypothetical protein